MKPRRPCAGRPFRVRYSEPVARAICERIAAGESWASMASRGRMPSKNTIYCWRDSYPVFAEAFAQAREIAGERKGDPTLPVERPAIFDRLKPEDMRRQMDEDDPPVRGPNEMKRKTPDRWGRVTHVRYSEPLAEAICERIAAGDTLNSFFNTGGFPSMNTYGLWLKTKPGFTERVAEAKQLGAEARFERSLEVALASGDDKLIVATLLAHAERLDPERFGSRRPSGGDGERPTRMIVVRHFERARREDGTEYVRAIDDIQQVEDQR